MERDIKVSEQANQQTKKPYETPLITDLGSVESLTKGSATAGSDGTSGSA